MPTHDYSLANQSGASFRTDLNNALAAIQSNNSNSSSPATTVAYQWWADTTSGTLKIRNSANNAWVELLQLDGTLTLEDGSVSTPALAFRDDLNTGIFSSAADTFNVATAGLERMELGAETIFNEAGADVDFRIESDTKTHMFYLDAGNDRIGINTGSPSCVFQINDAASGGDGITDILKLNGSPNNTNDGVRLQFSRVGGACGSISLEKVASNNTTDMIFGTRSGNTESESMRITGGGNMLLGASSALEISGHTPRFQMLGTNHNTQTFSVISNSADANPAYIFLAKQRSGAVGGTTSVNDGDRIGEIRFNGHDGNDFAHETALIASEVDASPSTNVMPGRLLFFTTASNAGSVTERMRIDSDGLVGIGTTTATKVLELDNTGRSSFSTCFMHAAGANNVRVLGLRSGRTLLTPADMIHFFDHNGSLVGSITSTTSATSFNTSSDYRLKENATPISDGITRLKTLKPYRFNWKNDPTTTVDGFFAHEVTAVPEAISGTKDQIATADDANDEVKEGDPMYQQIDQSKLVPLLVAAMQELITKVETLEAA